MLCLIPIVGGLLIMMGQHEHSEALFYYFRLEGNQFKDRSLQFRGKRLLRLFARVQEEMEERDWLKKKLGYARH